VPDVQTISDESTDRPDRVSVEARLLAPRGIRYRQLEWLLESVHRQAAGRGGFKHARRPQAVDIRVFDDAAAPPERYIARVRSEAGDPVREIRIPFPLGDEIQALIAARPDYKTIRPSAVADDAKGAVTVTVPYVDGPNDQYLAKLGYVRALMEWSVWTLELFGKFEALADLTFVGEHRGTKVVFVRVTRDQFAQLGLQRAEEDIGAYQGEFLAGVMNGQISEAAVQKKVEVRRARSYREILASLPREQVSVASSLR
jgi:hypothetical protein